MANQDKLNEVKHFFVIILEYSMRSVINGRDCQSQVIPPQHWEINTEPLEKRQK